MVELQDHFNTHFRTRCREEVYKQNEEMIFQETSLNLTTQPIRNNKLGIQKVDFLNYEVKSNYEFPNPAKSGLMSMTSTLVMPVMDQTKFKGTILYFHPTLFDRSAVPSSQSDYYQGIAGLYTSFGYAVIFFDYIGFKPNETHPYVLYPEQNVQSAIAAANEGLEIMISQYNIQNFSIQTVGYSEGGAYSIWFNKCMSRDYSCSYIKVKLNSRFIVGASVGLEGAYDLYDVVRPFLIEKVGRNIDNNKFNIENQLVTNLIKPALSALTLFGYSTYSFSHPSFLSILDINFFNMNCNNPLEQLLCNINKTHTNLLNALKIDKVDQVALVDAIFWSAVHKNMSNTTYMGLIDIIDSHLNSVLAFVKEEVLESSEFKRSLVEASLMTYGNSTVFIFSLTRDSVVSVRNANNLIVRSVPKIINYKFFDNSKYKVCQSQYVTASVDHLSAEYLANIFSLRYFEKSFPQE